MPVTLTRGEFFDEIFDYRPGEHVGAIEPTGGGKTHLLYQCAHEAMRQNKQLRFMSLMPKPQSATTDAWAARLGLAETAQWPPPARFFWQAKPNGYVLWPRHRRDVPAAVNRDLVAEQLRKGIAAQYWDRNTITFADDLHVLAALMGLNPECEQHWTAGREMKAGLWGANQKPSGTTAGGAVSTYFYSASTHLFLGRDTDERNIKRFSEIGGVDPAELAAIVRSLRFHDIDGHPVSEKLYVDKRGPFLAVLMPW